MGCGVADAHAAEGAKVVTEGATQAEGVRDTASDEIAKGHLAAPAPRSADRL
jgi:hypothetical protein